MSRKNAASAVLFALTLAAGLWIFSRYTGGWERFVALVGLVSWSHWAVVALATSVFYLLDYARFYSLLRIFGHRLALWPGLRITCIGFLIADLTPNSELYQPLVVFLLTQEGVPAAAAAAAALAKSLYMVVWLCALTFLALRRSPEVSLPRALATSLPLYLTPLLLFTLFLAAISLFPDGVRSSVDRLLRWKRLPAWGRRLALIVEEFTQALARLGRSTHPMHLAYHAASLLTVVMYGVVGYTLCRAVGLEITVGKAAAVFTASFFVGYVAPVPGAIGVAELATNYLLGPEMSEKGMAVSILLRLACWYAIWIPGAVLLLELVRERGWGWLSGLYRVKTRA